MARLYFSYLLGSLAIIASLFLLLCLWPSPMTVFIGDVIGACSDEQPPVPPLESDDSASLLQVALKARPGHHRQEPDVSTTGSTTQAVTGKIDLQAKKHKRIEWVGDLISQQHVISALSAALKLSVFDVISSFAEGVSFSELCSKLHTSSKGLDALLVTLVTCGFVSQDPRTKKLSCEPKGGLPEELITELLGFQVSSQRQFYYLPESVMQGRAVGLTEVLGNYSSLYKARAEIPDVAKYWDPWMKLQNTQEGGKYLDDKLDDLISYSKSDYGSSSFKMLDWCGNTGYNALHAVGRFPSMHATVLDLPTQCEKARSAIKASGMESRVDTLPCDLTDLNFSLAPLKFDGVLMTHTIREWSAKDVYRFFTLIRDALNPGGSLVVDMVELRPTGEYPPGPVESGLVPSYFLASASNDQHTHHVDQINQTLMNAGFVDIQFENTCADVYVMAEGACAWLRARAQ